MPEWLTVEVVDGAFPASEWRRAHENALIEAAVTNGASFWDWHTTRWGVVLELVFDSDERLERYRSLPVIRAALDAVPDRAHGLLVYRGRGGGSGALVPRQPGPRPAAGAAALPEPAPDEYIRLTSDRGSPAALFTGDRGLTGC
ncbi:MAG: hypothetical protein JWP62_2941 [Blastococcus sp.]|jgi:hypothetical protein|nr:hypothetical protein [Blastococcus sp.]